MSINDTVSCYKIINRTETINEENLTFVIHFDCHILISKNINNRDITGTKLFYPRIEDARM